MSNVIKKSLQTTIFTTVLGAVAVSPSIAYTINNDLIDLSPTSPWSVSKAGQGAKAYCTLSKTFKDDIILTLAESNNEALTFALDFQKDRFVTKSIYNIILATDNGDSRSYEINPATEKAFIIRVKDDPEFYENLWKSNSIIVSVNTENYRFKTADFIEGRFNISSCLSSLEKAPETKAEKPQVSSVAPEIKKIPVSSTSEIAVTEKAVHIATMSPGEALSKAPRIENAAFSTERMHDLSKVAKEVSVLKSENASLKKALFNEKQKYEEKIALLKSEQNSEPDTGLLQKISLLNSENEKLKTEIRESAKAKSVAATSISTKLNAEIERLRTENNVLKTSLNAARIGQEKQGLETVSLSDYEDLQDKNTVLSQQIRSLTTENFKLKNMLSEASIVSNNTNSQTKDLVAENQSLKKEAILKDSRIEMLQSTLSNAQSKIENYNSLQQQVSALQSQNNALTESYAALESASGQVTPSNADAELKALQMRYTEQQRELERMADEMEKERQSFRLEQQRLETMLFDPAVTEQKQLAHLAKLERELQLANQALAEQRAMYEGGAPMSDTTRKALKPVSQMTNSERVTMMEMSKEIQRLRDEIDRLRRMPKPVIVEKAEVTEKKVVIARGQTLENATPVEDIMPSKSMPDETPMLPPVTAISSLEEQPAPATMQPTDNDNIKVELVEMEPASSNMAPDVIEVEMKEPSSAIKTNDVVVETKPAPVKAEQPKIQMASAAPPKILALPDPETERLLKSNDKNLKVIQRQNGTVFWASEDMKGTVIRKHMQGKEFETSVDEMIANLKSKCPINMDIDPVLLRKGQTESLYAYDAKCGESTIGLVFFTKDGQTVSTVSYGAHQANKDVLENAREKLIDTLMNQMQS